MKDPKTIKIWLDAGHGGAETGAAYFGVEEKNYNLFIALELEKRLKARGFVVEMTRRDDSAHSIAERCNRANEWGADYFLSIHHNAGGGDGYEVIHSIHHGVGQELAEAIALEFKALGQNAHGKNAVYDRESENNPGHDYYGVIRQTNMPAVITEYAFLDTKDRFDIDTREEQLAEAGALERGLYWYILGAI
jgi:N-acetylmuramoyl-L-alanine amidase